MAIGKLPGNGELRLGPVTLPEGRRILNVRPQPIWVTNEPVPRPGQLWSQLSAMLPGTGLVPILLAGLEGSTARPWDEDLWFSGPFDITHLDELDAADVLAEGWPDEVEDDLDEDDPDSLAAELAPFGRQFPGLAPPEQARLGETELQRSLDSLPPARIGLVPATRPADALAVLGWATTDQYPDPCPLSAVLRTWEDRFGARLLEVGFAEIRLFVERPPHDLPSAQRN